MNEIPVAPQWALDAGLTAGSFERLMRLLASALDNLGLHNRQISERDATIHVILSTTSFIEVRLSNLIQIVRQRPLDEWADIVAHHVAPLSELSLEITLEQAEPLLRVKLQQSGIEVGLEPITNVEHVAMGLDQVSVIDLPTMVQTVTSAMLESWGLTVEEVRSRGLANLRSLPWPKEHRFTLQSGSISGYEDVHDHFVASRAILLGDRIADVHRGAIIAIPRRSSLFVHDIRDQFAAGTAMVLMADLASDLYKRGPGSLSPLLYWWHDGSIEAITIDTTTYELKPRALRQLLFGGANNTRSAKRGTKD